MRKKIEKSLKLKYPPSKLYIEDIENICTVLKDCEPDSAIDIFTQDFEYDSLEEFIKEEYGNKHNFLKIVLKFKKEQCIEKVSVTFDENSEFYSPINNLVFTGAYNKILNIIQNNKPYLFFKSRNILFLILFVVISLVSILLIFGDALIEAYKAVIIILMFVIPFSLLSLNDHLKASNIVLERRSEVKNFFVRKKDELIKDGIMVGLTVILTALITWYLTRK